MKVKDFIAALLKADPELTVCQFTETGPLEITDLGLFRGSHRIDMSPKMIYGHADGKYIGIGNPGDYDISAPLEYCEPVEDLFAGLE